MTPSVLLLLLSMMALAAGRTVPGGSGSGSANRPLGVSDIIHKINENLENLFGDDVMTNVQDNADACTSTTCKWPKDGNTVPVHYMISRDFSRLQNKFITDVMKYFEEKTCIKFKALRGKTSSSDYIHIVSETGCWSYVGRIGGMQKLSLRIGGCLTTSIVQHELLHALGFHHEHTRSDRDTFVIINTANIMEGREGNFEKRNTNNLGTPYDFTSVMQYSNTAFSKNGEPTIVAIHDPNLQFGHSEISDNDIARINNLYNCSAPTS